MSKKKIIQYIPRVIVAFILLQTLFFKFGIGGPEFLEESKELFSTISIAIFGDAEMEGVLRVGTGILELIASILILIPGTAAYGALLSLGVMSGAILSHIIFIGIVVRDDGGQLFIMAIVVALASAKVVYDERAKLLRFM